MRDFRAVRDDSGRVEEEVRPAESGTPPNKATFSVFTDSCVHIRHPSKKGRQSPLERLVSDLSFSLALGSSEQ
jgi:hypothetical protein